MAQKRTFNWLAVLKRYRIAYVTKGSNVSEGNINIKCPFCGPRDPSEHMGLSTHGSEWACWRDSTHRGRSPEKLVYKLLQSQGVSWSEVATLCGQTERKNLSELEIQLQKLKGGLVPVEKNKYDALIWDWNGKHQPFDKKPSALLYHGEQFLRSRRIPLAYAHECKLMYGVSGFFRYRVIFPIFDERYQEVSWTARSISPLGVPRYLSVKAESDEPWNVKRQLYGIHELFNRPLPFGYSRDPWPTSGIILVEGPTDVLRFNYVGRLYGFYALGVFGSSLSSTQRMKVRALLNHTPQLFVAFDPDNHKGTLTEAAHFSDYQAFPYFTRRQQDFGAMSNGDLHECCREMFKISCPDKITRRDRYLDMQKFYDRHLEEDKEYAEEYAGF